MWPAIWAAIKAGALGFAYWVTGKEQDTGRKLQTADDQAGELKAAQNEKTIEQKVNAESRADVDADNSKFMRQ